MKSGSYKATPLANIQRGLTCDLSDFSLNISQWLPFISESSWYVLKHLYLHGISSGLVMGSSRMRPESLRSSFYDETGISKPIGIHVSMEYLPTFTIHLCRRYKHSSPMDPMGLDTVH